jgi:hypothetical protein
MLERVREIRFVETFETIVWVKEMFVPQTTGTNVPNTPNNMRKVS